MIPEYRKKFNDQFSQESYDRVKTMVEQRCGVPTGFRLAETPVFLPMSFREKLVDVSTAIIDQIKAMSEEELREAIPAQHRMSGASKKPHFLTIDFGICRDEKGEISPELIELQAFPSLYGFKKVYEDILIEAYPFLGELKTTMSSEEYFKEMKRLVVGDENPENVILLEIFPEKQKTNVDFYTTEKELGIPVVCLTKLIKEGNKLFYEKGGRKIPINRIYNRVIFDELDRMPDLDLAYDFKEEVDVEWITHPDWFFEISKYILPKLNHEYIPKSYYLKDFPANENLSDFVLKPLFSFAGAGINLNPTKEDIDAISDKDNYIMQRKVFYAPLFEDPEGDKAKAEIRMMFFWHPDEEDPVWVNNLVRMTKVAMVNVDFNKKGAIWIGSSYAFFV